MNRLQITHLLFSLFVCISSLNHASDAAGSDSSAPAENGKPRSKISREAKLVLVGMGVGGLLAGGFVATRSGNNEDDAKKSSGGSGFFATTAAIIATGAGLAGAGVYAAYSSFPSVRKMLGIQGLEEGQARHTGMLKGLQSDVAGVAQGVEANGQAIAGVQKEVAATREDLKNGFAQARTDLGRVEGLITENTGVLQTVQQDVVTNKHLIQAQEEQRKQDHEELQRKMVSGFNAVHVSQQATQDAVYETSDELQGDLAVLCCVLKDQSAEQAAAAARREAALQAKLEKTRLESEQRGMEVMAKLHALEGRLAHMPQETAAATVQAVSAAFLPRGSTIENRLSSSPDSPRGSCSGSDKPKSRLLQVLEAASVVNPGSAVSSSSPRKRSPTRKVAGHSGKRRGSRSPSPVIVVKDEVD